METATTTASTTGRAGAMRAIVPAAPAAPPAPPSIPSPPYPASTIADMGMSLWGKTIASSGWRIAAGIFIPLLATFSVGTIVYELPAAGVTAVATLSGFFLWPILIVIIAAIVGILIMYKTFGLVHGYIDSGKAEHHWHVVWGWLSSPLRVVETQDKVLAVEGKVDRLLLAQGARP